MAETTARVLRLLSLLQARTVWTSSDLADRLEVTRRTVRRDIDRLRELGYPIEATSGSEGGYRLGSGGRMPLLAFTDEEAVAAAICLRLGAVGSVAGVAEPAVGALAKLDQVLPMRLKPEVAAFEAATVALPERRAPLVDADVLAALARAQRDGVRARFDYRRRDDQTAERNVEVYRLVTTGSLWYLFGFDLDRDDWRIFRLDRLSDLHVTTFRFQPRKAPDPAAYLKKALEQPQWRCQATVHLDADVETVARRVPAAHGHARADPCGGTLLVAGADRLDDLARHLIWVAHDLDARLTVVESDDLAAALRGVLERVERLVRID